MGAHFDKQRRKWLATCSLQPEGKRTVIGYFPTREEAEAAHAAFAATHRTGRRTAEDRFWRKVRLGLGCWEWLGAPASTGYGHLDYEGRRMGAHRFSWTLHNGPIPDGLSVLHHCDNRLCVNPDHLYLGTQADNMRDVAERQRGTLGVRPARAKFTDDEVRKIRARYIAGGISYTALGRVYGVSKGAIAHIVTRRCYADVA